MAPVAMIRVFLRMALVLFSMSLLLFAYLDKGTDEYTLTLYSLVITGVFALALIIALKKTQQNRKTN